jgi:hypothetical protein
MKKVVGFGVGSGSVSIVRGTDPGIRIRTKMSRIPNIDFKFALPVTWVSKNHMYESVNEQTLKVITYYPYRYNPTRSHLVLTSLLLITN